jgi:hypothetical protein
METRRRRARPVLFATALAAAAVALVGGQIRATCRCGAGDLELVFVLDATGSMGPVIGTVKAQAERIVEILESQVESLRVGAVAFRTRDDSEMPQPATIDLTADRAKLVAWLRTLKAQAGGEEAVGDALAAALDQMSWTAKARKVIVLVGDEAPAGAAGRALVDLAVRALSRSIVVHTITQSDTAWLYYFNWMRNVDPPGAQALVERYGSMDNLKNTFRLPLFEQMAAAAGGRAVGTADTREIVKWLLAFALGYGDEAAPPELPQPAPPAPKADPLPRHDGRTRLGWVRYGGDWKSPRSFDGLVRHLGSLVRIDLDERPAIVSLADAELWRYPLLYLSGHGPVELTASERAGLKAYVELGGVLWADNCCGKPLFETTLLDQLARALPGIDLAPLGRSHALFDIGHVIDGVRLAVAHRSGEFVTREATVRATVSAAGGAVIYTPHGLGAGWKTYDAGACCLMHDDDALRLSENIVLFALSR